MMSSHWAKILQTSGHTLDQIIFRADDPIVTDVYTFNLFISNHEAIIFHVSLKASPPTTVKKTITFCSLSKVKPLTSNHDLAMSLVVSSPHFIEHVAAYDAEIS